MYICIYIYIYVRAAAAEVASFGLVGPTVVGIATAPDYVC